MKSDISKNSPVAIPWVIVGCGVQGRQIGAAVLAAAKVSGEQVLGYLDDDSTRWGDTLLDLPILGPLAWAAGPQPLNVAVALGQAPLKRQVVANLRAMGGHLRFPPVIHPFTSIGPGVQLADGVVVQAGAVLLCDLCVGEFTIIGAASALGHDTRVGAYNFLSPGLRLAGFSSVGDDCITGLNTCLLGHMTLGSGSISGAGTVITRDVPPGDKVVGVPARSIKTILA